MGPISPLHISGGTTRDLRFDVVRTVSEVLTSMLWIRCRARLLARHRDSQAFLGGDQVVGV
jgi:hypothetical protein